MDSTTSFSKASRTSEAHQNLVFFDNALDSTLDIQGADQSGILPPTKANIDISDWLSRPVHLGSFRWGAALGDFTWGSSPGTIFGANVINPWYLFLNSANVKPKLRNYKLLRGNLNVKIMVNGTPFHFGRLMVTYYPMQEFIANEIAPANIPRRHSHKINYSQLPHVWVNPGSNQSSTIVCPFVWPYDYIDLQNSVFDTVVNSTGTGIGLLGNIQFNVFNQLQTVSDTASEHVEVSVYAWMSDAHFCGPTDSDILVPTGEYGEGAVSAPASALAAVAGKLSTLPIIGRFAKATEIASRAVSSVAKLFGFSRPIILSDHAPMRNLAYSQMATGIGGDLMYKLTLDPKQELCVTNDAVGLANEDHMSIMHTAGHESFLCTFAYPSTANVTDALVVTGTTVDRIYVNPICGELSSLTEEGVTHTVYHLPSIAYVSSAFQYWRGPIKYRFQAVSSVFHRGRIQIRYDPNDTNAANNGTLDTSNVNYNWVWDLSESSDFEIVIDWHQSVHYRQVESFEDIEIPGPNCFVPGIPEIRFHNGIFQLLVLNSLVSPDATVPVSINCFISAAEGFELQQAGNPVINNVFFDGTRLINNEQLVPTGDIEYDSGLDGAEECCGEDVAQLTPLPIQPDHNLVYFGQNIVSLRNVMKRYHAMKFLFCPQASTTDDICTLKIDVPRMPFGFGPCEHTTFYGPSPINYAKCSLEVTNPISYFQVGYCCERGSTRIKMSLSGKTTNPLKVLVSRIPSVFDFEVDMNEPLASFVAKDRLAVGYNSISNGAAYSSDPPYQFVNCGSQAYNLETQSGVEFEIPFQTELRFVVPGATMNRNLLLPWGLYRVTNARILIDLIGTNTQNYIGMRPRLYQAIGEDFNLSWYLGAPCLMKGPGTVAA